MNDQQASVSQQGLDQQSQHYTSVSPGIFLPRSSRQNGRYIPVSHEIHSTSPPAHTTLCAQLFFHLRRFFPWHHASRPDSKKHRTLPTTNTTHISTQISPSATNFYRPYPSLTFRSPPHEGRTPGTTPPPNSQVTRWCVVSTLDGLAECVQSIVSAADEEAVLYVFFYPAACGDLLVVNLQCTVYIINLTLLGGRAGLDARGTFSMSQLEASIGTPIPSKSCDARRSPEIGILPSLRGVLESPAVSKVCFDTRSIVSALSWRVHGVVMRGVGDVQVMELAGRRSRSSGESDYARRAPVCEKKVGSMPRDLRTCLE